MLFHEGFPHGVSLRASDPGPLWWLLLLQLSSNHLAKRGPRSLNGTPHRRRSEGEVGGVAEVCKVCRP